LFYLELDALVFEGSVERKFVVLTPVYTDSDTDTDKPRGRGRGREGEREKDRDRKRGRERARARERERERTYTFRLLGSLTSSLNLSHASACRELYMYVYICKYVCIHM